MVQRDCANAGLIQPFGLHGSGAGSWQPVIKTLSEWARVAVTGFVRVLACFVASSMFEHAQGHVGVLAA